MRSSIRPVAPEASAPASRLVAQVFEAIQDADFDVLEACLHPDIVYRRPSHPILIGRDQVMDFYRRARSALTSTILVHDMIEQGARVVALGLVQGRARDGSLISEQFADAFTVDHNQIRLRTTYFFRHGF